MARKVRDEAKETALHENYAKRKAYEELYAQSECTPERLWSDGRLLAVMAGGPYARALEVMNPVEDDRVPTMAVDKHFRCYYNKTFVLQLVQQAKAVSKENPCPMCGAEVHSELAYVAGVIWHEAQHPLRRHFERANIKTKINTHRWNIATDYEINDDALELFADLHKFTTQVLKKPVSKMCLPSMCLLPQQKNLPPYLSAEEYYVLIEDDENSSECGSGATGAPQEWDRGEPSATNPVPGISEGFADLVIQEVSKAIQEGASRGLGSLNRHLDWANSNLAKSKYNYKREFSRLLRTTAARLFGYSRKDTKKLHRKSAALNYDVVYPSYFENDPNILVVVDTSGSMMGPRIQHALKELEAILKSVRGRVNFVCAEDGAGTLQKVKSMSEISLRGGGGTDMRKGVIGAISQALKTDKDKPNLVVLITDLETNYPSLEDMRGCELFVVGVCEKNTSRYGEPVPSWAKYVWVPVSA